MADAGDTFGSDEGRDQLGVDLAAEARKLGLYLEAGNFTSTAEGRPVLVAAFTIGDRAFEPAVQNPDQASVDDAFRAMEIDGTAEAAQLDAMIEELGDDD